MDNPATYPSVTQAHGLSSQGGLQLTDAPLRLGPSPGRGLVFVGQLPPGLLRGKHLLCSQDLVPVLGVIGGRALALPWYKPIRVGKLALRLWPAGAGPGSSVLQVQTPHGTLVDARFATVTPLPGCAPIQFPDSCDILLVDATHAARTWATDTETKDFLNHLSTAGSQTEPVTVRIDDPLIALSMLELLKEQIDFTVSPRLARLDRRYAATGWPQASPRRQATVHLQWSDPAPAEANATVTAAADPKNPFALAWDSVADGPGLRALIAQCKPKYVVAVGDGAPVFCSQLRSSGYDATALTAQAQLPLV